MAVSPPEPRRSGPRFPWWGAAGVALFAAGLWLLVTDAPVWNTTWYLAAWYGYLTVLDALLFQLRGRSFLCGGRRELGAMLLWSVPFWFAFEAYNLVLRNWYYVFGLRSYGARLAYSCAAFATVLPACFFHAELLSALGAAFPGGLSQTPAIQFLGGRSQTPAPQERGPAGPHPQCRAAPGEPCGLGRFGTARGNRPPPRRLRATRGGSWRDRPLRVGPGLEAACLALGAACLVAPLLWPRYAYPLVWGAPLLVPEVLNRRLGAPSLLADLERGDRGRLLRLLAGGLLAGIAWELFNYPARTKWIYTVPGLEELKLFEMPLVGFGGFPVLALGAFASYSLLSHLLRGGRSWEAGAPRATRRPAPRWLYATAVAGALAGSYAVLGAMERSTLHSQRPVLQELAGLGPAAAERLEAAGVATPERLYRAAGKGRIDALARETGLLPGALVAAVRHARLALHKGMGAPRARLLLAAGFEGPGDLVGADPESLQRRLAAIAASRDLPPPRRAEVAVWIRAARPDGRPRR